MVFQGALYHVSPEWIPKLILRKSPIVVLYRGGHLQDCKAYSSGKGGENWQNSYEKKKKNHYESLYFQGIRRLNDNIK